MVGDFYFFSLCYFGGFLIFRSKILVEDYLLYFVLSEKKLNKDLLLIPGVVPFSIETTRVSINCKRETEGKARGKLINNNRQLVKSRRLVRPFFVKNVCWYSFIILFHFFFSRVFFGTFVIIV